MAKDKGYIKLYRQIEDNFLWHPSGSDKFDVRSAWVDLIIQANHTTKSWVCGAQKIVVKRGQLITSIRHLAVRWNCSVHTAERYIKLFESEGMLYKESTNRYTVLTLVKYENFQGCVDTKETQSATQNEHRANSECNADCLQLNNDKKCTNNDKRMKKEKPSAFEDF